MSVCLCILISIVSSTSSWFVTAFVLFLLLDLYQFHLYLYLYFYLYFYLYLSLYFYRNRICNRNCNRICICICICIYNCLWVYESMSLFLSLNIYINFCIRDQVLPYRVSSNELIHSSMRREFTKELTICNARYFTHILLLHLWLTSIVADMLWEISKCRKTDHSRSPRAWSRKTAPM